jgi:hypothetical protein
VLLLPPITHALVADVLRNSTLPATAEVPRSRSTPN